jgi:hypothetical protein
MVRHFGIVAKGPLWRQLLSCALVYALVLQGMLFALGGAQLAAAVSTAPSPAIEVCLHDPADAAGLPDGHANGKVHCPFCLAATHQAMAAPCGWSASIIRTVIATALQPDVFGAPCATHPNSHRPRGPPLGA